MNYKDHKVYSKNQQIITAFLVPNIYLRYSKNLAVNFWDPLVFVYATDTSMADRKTIGRKKRDEFVQANINCKSHKFYTLHLEASKMYFYVLGKLAFCFSANFWSLDSMKGLCKDFLQIKSFAIN